MEEYKKWRSKTYDIWVMAISRTEANIMINNILSKFDKKVVGMGDIEEINKF